MCVRVSDCACVCAAGLLLAEGQLTCVCVCVCVCVCRRSTARRRAADVCVCVCACVSQVYCSQKGSSLCNDGGAGWAIAPVGTAANVDATQWTPQARGGRGDVRHPPGEGGGEGRI